MIELADVITDLVYGDCGKGKVSAYLANHTKYDFVARWNGGNNAGHTVFVNGEKFSTHMIPAGVFYNTISLIGPGCVLHPESFYEEISYLTSSGFDAENLVKVHPNCQIVTDEHIKFDKENLAAKLGTTAKGIAPAYAAKAARTGIQAHQILEKKYLFDGKLYGKVLCEGAQGVWLDVNHGIYPYVTSSETLPYAACSLGFPPQLIRNIYGCAKAYDTRSGEDPRFPISLLDDPDLLAIADAGTEYGTTTGRRRKVNWLNLDRLIEAINLTGSTQIIINKCDILEKVGLFKLFFNNSLNVFSKTDFFEFIESEVNKNCPLVREVNFSYSPELI